MVAGKFANVAATECNSKWDYLIKRQEELYSRPDDIRSEFARDYNRILHCKAYRRLKHKTQVFFATTNDHICTRIEHVNHVASVSATIAKHLGLNTELTDAIAVGHDLGHAPFGHEGEKIIEAIAQKELKEPFWHEKNGLDFVDKIETLPDPNGVEQNLSLTYAVRDGIVCHCGEVDDDSLIPRVDPIDLSTIQKPGEVAPFTWEACVVKIADKIAFLGRDIEDALRLKLIDPNQLPRSALQLLAKAKAMDLMSNNEALNTTVIMHHFIVDLCQGSDPAVGLRFSKEKVEFLKEVKAFSYSDIYYHPKLKYFKDYAKLIIESIFDKLMNCYDQDQTLRRVKEANNGSWLGKTFEEWLIQYSEVEPERKKALEFGNQVVYSLSDREAYARAILHYISGMTDSFAIKVFDDFTAF